jgi:hypothetical protein
VPGTSRALIELDLKSNPLGMSPGDPSFSAPFNHGAAQARVFLRNWSASQKRKYVKIPVSERRGAAKALVADKELGRIYNVATLHEAIKEGQDMNVYDFQIRPVLFAPLWDGKRWPIPPAPNAEDEPPSVQVPEGLWDLLMGNYERMNSPIEKERSDEAMRLATSMLFKHSSILFVTIDGKRSMRDNPFGFIEISRVTEKMAPVSPNTEFLTAMDLVEN